LFVLAVNTTIGQINCGGVWLERGVNPTPPRT
jgi:hypothetical protein